MNKLLFIGLMISLFGNQNNAPIDRYLNERYQAGQLNGNVLITKGGKTIYEKSFGYADGSKTTKLTKDYRFNIGSMYKEFPAVAIMQLQEKDQINLDDKISKYIPELPSWSEKVTVQHLLQYSSGLPTINWNAYFSKGIKVNEHHLIEEIKAVNELAFEPGTDYLYSNSNPILLIKIIENITHMAFSDYLQTHLFIPYGMESTVLKAEFPYEDKTLMAIPFDANFKEDAYHFAVKSLLFSATASDMNTWFEKLGDFKIVSERSVKKLSEKAKVGENIQSPLGHVDWDRDNMIEHSHHGSTANYEGIVRRFKQEEITIILLTNQKHSNVYEISEKLYEMVKQIHK